MNESFANDSLLTSIIVFNMLFYPLLANTVFGHEPFSRQRGRSLNLTVKVVDISRYRRAGGTAAVVEGKLLTCDRCNDIDQIVVAIMWIPSMEQGWALCGSCTQKLPEGLHAV
jgi:hypothetical protein